MKRILPFAAAAACLALAASACGSGSSSPTANKPSSTTVPNVKPVIGNPTSPVALTEDGSSLLEPYLQELVTPLTQAYSNISLAPAADGSGKGISDAAAGNVNLGGSDAYLAPTDFTQYPGLANIPVVVSGQAINYNLPGITNLKLSGSILGGIYEGTITKWNDSAIAALNPGVTLPAMTIVPVHREDSSGDTFLFSSFLTATNPTTWGSSTGPQEGTTVTWPTVAGALAASGNPGMVQTCSATPGCVAYIGVSAEASATTAKLGEAMLQNASGDFLQPTPATEAAAAQIGSVNIPANLAVSLIYQKGAQAYPITNFEYLILKTTQSSAQEALAVRTLLSWIIDTNGGSASNYLATEGFTALPTSVVPAVNGEIANVGPAS